MTDYSEGIDVVGLLVPKFAADVRFEYAGIVTEVHVTEWVRVKKGTPLAKIDSRETEILLQRARAAAAGPTAGGQSKRGLKDSSPSLLFLLFPLRPK